MNFSEFDTVDIEEKVRELDARIKKYEGRLSELQRLFQDHQHGGADGSAQIYNSNIRLKDGSYIQGGIISMGTGTSLTIQAGAININSSFHIVDTEGGAATDDLENISLDGAVDGQLLVLKPVSSSRTIVVKDVVGNIRLNGDFSMDHIQDTLILIQNAKAWYELSRSDNNI